MSIEPECAAVSEILDVLASGGDRSMASRDLLPLVYAELRPWMNEIGRAHV